ncbi:MAG: TrkA C-terminal domain-containing protein, partial [Bacteroidota bacterium]|nr:TrkA C-terminal domain-containing protein [Bacteroidota bacterium]
RYREIKAKGINVDHVNGLDSKIYRQLKLTPDNYIVIETGDDEQNLKISQMLRTDFQHKNIISRISRFSQKQSFEQLGIETIDVTQILATAIENLIIRPTTYHALVESFENFCVEEIQITNIKIDGLQLKHIPFHTDAVLIMIKRENSFLIPRGDTYFRIGDILIVFGTQTAFEDIRYKMG